MDYTSPESTTLVILACLVVAGVFCLIIEKWF